MSGFDPMLYSTVEDGVKGRLKKIQFLKKTASLYLHATSSL